MKAADEADFERRSLCLIREIFTDLRRPHFFFSIALLKGDQIQERLAVRPVTTFDMHKGPSFST